MARRAHLYGTIAAIALASQTTSANAQLLGGLFGPAPAPTPTPTPTPTPAPRPVRPFYGNIDPFYKDIGAFWRDISPFYGNIDPFWRNLNPFYKDIGAFWGNINPFYGNLISFDGTPAPAYEAIGAYWKDIGAFWNETDAAWGKLPALGGVTPEHQAVAARLDELVARSEALWGAAVQAKTGKAFRDGFANPLFAKYGLNPNDPASLNSLSAARRSQFMLDWYDGLMGYSGADRIDHWMGTANWTPALTQIQGSGAGTIVGLLDGTLLGDRDVANNVVYSGGVVNGLDGHGTGVASLIVGAHDRTGVMGIAPRALLVSFNPFDASDSASWADVRRGVLALSTKGASVINMSLGVPGWTLHPDWNGVFSDATVANATRNSVFVIAAGNDGKAQTQNLAWNWATDPNMIIVGSVDPAGKISSFSNMPGAACLIRNGGCREGDRLLNRFIVAPGELILVADGQGGVARRSGTSFAAPLVSGAITLLHDRWPWLRQHPDETVEIILHSAKDLGEAGPDPVYGHGLLDVTASQAPLDFSKLVYYEVSKHGIISRNANGILSSGLKSSWEADGAFFYMFEPIGDTLRDFVVPMSSRLLGRVPSISGSLEYFQSYVSDRFADYIISGGADTNGDGLPGFTDVRSFTTPARGGWSFGVAASAPRYSLRDGALEMGHSAVTFADPRQRVALTAGFGQGGMALAPRGGFGLRSDYGSGDGGVNPILGFASGGGFMSAEVRLAPGLTLATGFSESGGKLPDGLSEEDRRAFIDIDPFFASAMNVSLTQRLGRSASLTASYTRLDEDNGLLGVQSVASGDLRHGAASDAATLGATVELKGGFTITATATAARTSAGGVQALTTAQALTSTAGAFALSKAGLLGRRDMMRLSLVQPLHIESGALNVSGVGVLDRDTGALGEFTNRFDVGGGKRRIVGEMLYAAPVTADGEFSLFGRAELRPSANGEGEDFIAGGRLRIGF